MIILGIDTSTAYAGVGLSVDGTVTAETWRSQHNHGREAMPAVMRLLDAVSLTPADIDAVAVAQGPGGFSAVRVGIATAQGLIGPTKSKLIAVPTHLIQAYAHRESSRKRVVSLIPVGRNQLSFAVYATPFTAVDVEDQSGICSIDDVAERFDDSETLICGEDAIGQYDTEASVDQTQIRNPEILLKIALERLKNGMVVKGFIEPIYSRPPTITAPRAT